MKKKFIFLFISVSLSAFAQNRFTKDAELRKIYGFEYERMSDSIKPYINSLNPKYRYEAIKSMASVQDTGIVNQLLLLLESEKTDSVKLAIINSLSQLDCKLSFNGLLNYYEKLPASSIKWATLASIGKVSQSNVSQFFLNSFSDNNKPDSFFVSNWLRGLYLAKRRKQLDWDKNNQTILKCLETILEKNWGDASEVNFYYSKIVNYAQVEKPSVIKLTANSKKEIDNRLITIKSPYKKLDIISSFNLSDIICREFIFSDYHPLIRTYALDNYLTHHTWNNVINESFIQSIFDQMDVALTSRMCEYIIAQKQLNKTVDISVHALENVQRQLFLPRDFETWIDLQKAILSFEGKTYHYKSCFETGYKNPIDWEYIVKIDAFQKVKITTGKGIMIVLLKVNEAPSTVANFLKLTDQGYYNGKYFHRMVPNFVVQGGCPRGDGWGSLDWNQRSELSGNSKYEKGSLGIASVGKDSEGVQFFISHTYAPHLDGRYTIFAEVIKGFEVIDNLMIGDEIISVERL